MRKTSLFVILISLFMITNVKAIEVKITCPEVIAYGSTGKCNVTATTSADEIDYVVSNVTHSSTGNINVTGYTAGTTTLAGGTSNNIGTLSVKPSATSGSGKATVKITIKNDGNSEMNFTESSDSIAIVSSVNTLDSITINDKKITIANKDLTSYTAETNGKTAKIEATPTDSSATVSGLGTKNLECGDNKVTLSVKATNGSNKDYTLNIKRKCEENVLKNITLSSGTLNPKFDKKTTDYKVTVSKDIEKITIKGEKNYDKQIITGEVTDAALVFGPNNFVLTVTNEDNKEIKYNISVTRDETLTSNALLKSLSLSSGKIKFDPNTFEYKTRVLYEVEKVDVLAAPAVDSSKVTAKGSDKLIVGENTVIVKVTTENNESKEYKILITRLKQGETIGDNPNIKSLTIDGYNLNFDYNTDKYKLLIGEEEKLNINVEMEDELATYQIVGNHDLKNKSIIQIVAKSADEEKSRTYTIEIAKPTSNKIFYIIGIGLLSLLVIGLAVAYYFVNKKKKSKVDANGFKLEEQETEQLITDKIINNEGPINTPIINDNAVQNQETSPSLKCPYCTRELLTVTEKCPYCGNNLY